MSNSRIHVRAVLAVLIAGCVAVSRLVPLIAAGTFFVGNGSVSLTSLDAPYLQNFDTLASSRSASSVPVMPTFCVSQLTRNCGA